MKDWKIVGLCLVSALVLALGGIAVGQQTAQQTSSTNDQDREWLLGSILGDESEVLLGELAQTHSLSVHPQVRSLGLTLVTDHLVSFNEASDLAVRKKITPDYQLSPELNQDVKRFVKLFGGSFDYQWVEFEVVDHQNDIADAQEEVEEGQDPEIKAFAAREIVMLRRHLALSRATLAVIRSDNNGQPTPTPKPTATPTATPTPTASPTPTATPLKK